MNYPHPGLYKAYNRASHTVSKTRQVVMLYDGAIRFLQQAFEAMERKEFELRYQKLSRVSDIIIGLQACLDFDAGKDAAQALSDFYSSIDMRVFSLHRTNDLEACRAIINEIKEMRDVWDRIDQGTADATARQAENSADPQVDPQTFSA